MTWTKHLVRALAVALALGSLAACDLAVNLHLAGRARDQWTRSYPLASGGRLELLNVNGRITAEATDGASVEVTAEREAKGTTDEAAQELLGRIEMREEVSESRVRIEVRPPQGTTGSQEITWTVRVPRGVAVDLRTVNGGIHLNGLDGEVRVRSTNGGIRADALRATALDGAVTNGGIDIRQVAPLTDGSFELEAVNGGINLAVPGGSRADVSARCVNGRVAVSELELQTEGEQSARRVQGRLNGGGARVTLDVTNGGIRLTRSS